MRYFSFADTLIAAVLQLSIFSNSFFFFFFVKFYVTFIKLFCFTYQLRLRDSGGNTKGHKDGGRLGWGGPSCDITCIFLIFLLFVAVLIFVILYLYLLENSSKVGVYCCIIRC